MGVAQLAASVFCSLGHLNLNDSKTVKDWCMMVEIFRSHLNLEKGKKKKKIHLLLNLINPGSVAIKRVRGQKLEPRI